MNRILIVEDDESLARGIVFALDREGFKVDLAPNINDGKAAFLKEKYDLIVLDVTLPDGNGFDLCQFIREKYEVPIIFLTACDEEVNVVQGLDMGADDYITKPFRLREFISRIKAVLRRRVKKNKEHGEIIKSKDILFKHQEMKVYKNDCEILLTRVEYKLLAYFMQNPLQALSRDKILDKLWDIEGDFIDSNTLSVYIRRLREKIEDNPSSPEYIVTVRGIGYKWNQRSDGR